MALVCLLFSTACAAEVDPRTVGDRQELCGGRVPRDLSEAAVGRSLAALIELNGFDATAKVGDCSLADDSGAVLDVEVVADPTGQLARILQDLASTPNFEGDSVSAVAGEGPQTQAYVAVDDTNYVRILANGGTSPDQRSAALALAFTVAERTQRVP